MFSNNNTPGWTTTLRAVIPRKPGQPSAAVEVSGSRDGKRAKRGRVLWLWWFPAKGHGSRMPLLTGGRGGINPPRRGAKCGGTETAWGTDGESCQRCKLMSRQVSPDPRQCRHRKWSRPKDRQKPELARAALPPRHAQRETKRNRELPVDQRAAYAEVVTFARSICFFGRSPSVRYSSGRRRSEKHSTRLALPSSTGGPLFRSEPILRCAEISQQRSGSALVSCTGERPSRWGRGRGGGWGEEGRGWD